MSKQRHGPVRSYSVSCADLLASTVSLTESEGEQELATVRSRRFRAGYVLTIGDNIYSFEFGLGSTIFGTVSRRDRKGYEAMIRMLRNGVIAVDVAGETFLVHASHDAFLAVERVRRNSNGAAHVVHAGDARILRTTSHKVRRKGHPFTFDFVEPCPALLIPLLVIIIKENVGRSAALHFQSNHGMALFAPTAPSLAVTAAFGAAAG